MQDTLRSFNNSFVPAFMFYKVIPKITYKNIISVNNKEFRDMLRAQKYETNVLYIGTKVICNNDLCTVIYDLANLTIEVETILTENDDINYESIRKYIMVGKYFYILEEDMLYKCKTLPRSSHLKKYILPQGFYIRQDCYTYITGYDEKIGDMCLFKNKFMTKSARNN